MERKSLVVVFSILVLLLAAQEVVVKTEALTEAQTEVLKEALTAAQTEALTEVLTEAQTEEQTEALIPCERLSTIFIEPCFGLIDSIKCNSICVGRERAISGRCRNGRCFCTFRNCPPISDVLEE